MYALIENSIVINVSELTAELALDWGWTLLPEGYGMGDFYADGVWTKSPQPEPTPLPEINLDEYKLAKYKQASQNLQTFLLKNPLKSSCHGDKEAYYDATSEMQSKLANSFSTHVILTQQGITDVFTWFDTTNFCEVWTDAEVIDLMKEMKAYVTTKESALQHMRVQINNAVTVAEVDTVVIEFVEATT